ncbi:Uncharacterized protein GBIM_15819 [Gryllus bimaculatus]|nr:Uncharacterized protein GBIM_15819 [Gryllus bimaculatus]
MPSVMLAVDHINESPNVLRNYMLHMYWNDTEKSKQNLKFIQKCYFCNSLRETLKHLSVVSTPKSAE